MKITKITTEEFNKKLSEHGRRGKHDELNKTIEESETPIKLTFDDVNERDRVYYNLLNQHKNKGWLVSINRLKNTIYINNNKGGEDK